MLFNSYTFFIFFLAVLVLYYSLPGWKTRKGILLVASYFFYAVWNPPFVILLWISTVGDWFLAKAIYRTDVNSKKRLYLLSSLGINLGLLFYFKYGGFLLDNFVALLSLVGVNYQAPEWNIVLPVGISFYTFQTLSYTIDIYKGAAKPWYSFLDFALYVTFFPQLVAGPIVRSYTFLKQCELPKRLDFENLNLGFVWLTLGIFLKVVIADALLAPAADQLYNSTVQPDFGSAWVGTLAFSGQILCDFAGYSICAIGAAKCLGFDLPKNFLYPYAAVGFSDFWRRWHITLSTWLRDYVYIPLGGNRRGVVRTYGNLMATMLIGGLWHGASWTFVIWGGIHGLYLVVERLLKKRFGKMAIFQSGVAQFSLAILTFLLVTITWVFFRAINFEQALGIASAMLFPMEVGNSILGLKVAVKVLVIVGAMLVICWVLRNKELEEIMQQSRWEFTSVSLAVMLYLIFTLPSPDRNFIYFQF